MSSSRSDGPARPLLVLALLIGAALLGTAPARAGYAVRVEYLDPNGTVVHLEGDDLSYRFFRRTVYRTPRGPGQRTFEDEEIVRREFPFMSSKVRFSSLRQVRFERRVGDGEETLVLLFETTTGRTFEMAASGLEGAAHPLSPILQFRASGRTERIPLDPVTRAALRQGRPSLLKVEFPGNPDRRRPPRPPRKPKPDPG